MVNLTGTELEALQRLVQRGQAAQAAVDEILRPKLTAAERKAAERARYRGQGLELLELWVVPSKRDQVRRYVGKVNRDAQLLQAEQELMQFARGKQ